ncbi:MAG: DUF1616 domain-containing protein [Methanosarcinales archaeon]|nr:DUF1616 domain-containing protein [Methanosarcinales archaeon]
MIKKLFQSSWIDLYLVLITTLLAIVFILIPPFDQIQLRIPFALVLLLFLPGYALTAAFYPGRDITGIERFTLSVGMSVAITVFDGIAVSMTEYLFRPMSIVVSLSIIILVFVILAFIVRSRVPHERRFNPDITPLIRSIKIKNEPTDIEKALIITMVGSIIIASGMLAYAKINYEDEKFTTLYILGPDQKAEGYQTEYFFGESTSTIVGIENYEHEHVNYILQVVLNGRELTRQDISLDHDEKWINDVSYIPDVMGSDLTLEFNLYKEKSDDKYRSVHLRVSSAVDYSQIDDMENYLIDVPEIANGNMEQDGYWIFDKKGSFTGNYVDHIYVSKSHSYEISLASDANKGDYGSIYQDIDASQEEGLAIMSLDIKDSITSDDSGKYLKQIVLNDKVVWEDDAEGNEGWQNVNFLVRLSETNRLILRVYAQDNIENGNVKVWFDNVRFKTLTTMNFKNWDSNLTLGVPTDITIAIENYENNYTEYDLEIRVDNIPIKLMRVRLDGREDWMETITFTPEVVGSNIKIEALLYKYGDWNEPYRTTHVSVSSSIDYDNLDTAQACVVTPPEILNSNMEYTSMWEFEGTNFSGLYTDSISKSPIISYELRLLPDVQSTDGDFGSFYQDVLSEEKGLVLLSFNVKDSIKSKDESCFTKQVLLNDRVVWEDDAAGDEGWMHNEVPVMLQKNNRLCMHVYMRKDNSDDMIVWWDDIEFKPFTSKKENDEVITPSPTPDEVTGLEIRGKIFSIKADDTVEIDDDIYGGFKSSEELTLKFSQNGLVDKGDATYTTKDDNYRYLWYQGTKYRLVDPSKADLLSKIIVNKKSKTLKANDEWELGNDYSIKIIAVKGNSVVLEFIGKDGLIDSDIFYEGDSYEYEPEVDGIKKFKMLSFDIDNIKLSSVKINNLYLFSESPHQVNIGDRYGEFEVDEIKTDRIIFKNIEDIKFIDTMGILDNRIKFRVADNKKIAYSYTLKTKPDKYKIKGDSYEIKTGKWMNLTGYNFPGFGFNLNKDMSYESLNMYFSGDGSITRNYAEYTASVDTNEVSFLGDIYHMHDYENTFILTKILLDEEERSLRIGEPLLLKNGYVLSVSDITGVTAVFKLHKDEKLIESEIYNQGDNIIFNKIFNDMEVPIFECIFENIVGGVIFIDYIKQYSEDPIELSIGRRYGDFEIITITNNEIVMANREQITISDGKSIMDNWIKFDVSGTKATPYVYKRLE